MFNFRNKKNKKTEEEITSLANKEEEIIESYEDDEEIGDIEEFETVSEIEEDIDDAEEEVEEDLEEIEEEEYPEFKPERPRGNIWRTLGNILFVVILASFIMITIDVISVGKYNKGPYFAIPVKTHDDGTVEYYGIGYKVIHYEQVQGRRDIEIGTWSLKYNVEPINLKDVDLAIAFNDDATKTYKKYYKKFVRIFSTLQRVDLDKHQITLGYIDEDGKYSFDIICEVAPEQLNLSTLEEGKAITIIGTLSKFEEKNEKENNRITIINVFAEQ